MPIYHFPLKKREEVAEDTMSFHFDTSGTDFKFKAGQNCDFTLEDPPYTDAEGTTRPFSLSSSPNLKDEIVITTRMRETAFKKSLKEMPLGAPVKVEGPMGSFTLHKDAMKPAVMLAGGIGITPILSMIRSFGVLLAVGIIVVLIADVVLSTAVLGAREYHSPTPQRDYTTDKGAAVLNDYARVNDPFARIGRESVTVQITSVVRASDTSFNVRWTERRYVNGAAAGLERWTAVGSIVLQPPRTEERLRKNPLGIYVNGLSWSRELDSSEGVKP